MILTLEQADFSAKNIGQLEVEIPIQDETTAILARYSSAPTASVTKALNRFVYEMKHNNIYDKIKLLVLPFLGSNIAEACIDVIGGKTPSNTSALIRQSKGIMYPTDSETHSTSRFSGTFATKDNYHVAVYNTEVVSSSSSYAVGQFGLYYLTADGYSQGVTTTSNKNASYILEGDSTIRKAKGCCSLTIVNNNALRIAKNGLSKVFNVVADQEAPLQSSAITEMLLCCYNNTKATSVKEPIGFFSLGLALTATEQDKFNTSVNNMMSVVLR